MPGQPLKFRFNTRELERNVRKLLMEHPQLARQAMRKVAINLRKEAMDRCPYLTGNLTLSITGDVQEYGQSYAACIYVPVNAPLHTKPSGKKKQDTPDNYAIYMHEGQYNLSADSLAHQAKTGKTVGPKFITRAIEENRESILEEIRRVLKK